MIIVRRVLPTEYYKYRSHLLSLDENSRYLRFGYRAPDTAINKTCDAVEADQSSHVLYCIENENLEFAGVAHIAIGETGSELAFSVLKEYQGQGYGTALMERAILHCRTRNIEKSHLVCLQTNAAIKRLCSKYGIAVKNDCGEAIGAVEFTKPDFDAFLQEMTVSNLAIVDYFSKRFPRFLINPHKAVES